MEMDRPESGGTLADVDALESLKIAQRDRRSGHLTNVRPSSLIKRFATPEEIANMIVYVASDAASATNGAALRVDGGDVRTIV